MDATRRLSEFAANLTYRDLPQEITETTKLFIADYYAACFAGYKVNHKFNEAVRQIIEGMGGAGETSCLFSETRLPAENAAYMNAIYAHGADMDDGNRKAMGHVAAHVMSAVFALAEKQKVIWEEVITAIHVGYEVYNRIAAAVQPGLVHRGFHSTGTAGAVACAAASAKLLGADADGIYNSMAIAAIQASGLIIIAESGQACKPLNPANAAKTGIFSARLSQLGAAGPIHPLESKKGWFHAMSEEVDESAVFDGLGSVFTMSESYLKPYPSCRHTHCGIEAAIKIREQIKTEQREFSWEEVESVQVYIYKNAIQIAGQIAVPKTDEDSKFSIHYSLATALMKGQYRLSDLPVSNLEPVLLSLIGKIQLIEDASMENTKEGIRGAKLVVRLHNGVQYEETVWIPKGDAANPFHWEDAQEKMIACAEGIFDKEKAMRILDRIRNLSEQEPFTGIQEFLVE